MSICCVCGISEKEADRTNHGVNITRGQAQITKWETSFRESCDGKKCWCAPCHKEKRLKELFELMDKRDEAKTKLS